MSVSIAIVTSVNIHIPHYNKEKGLTWWLTVEWWFLKLVISWNLQTQQSLHRLVWKTNKNHPASVWVGTPCWCERSKENGQTGFSWQRGYDNANDNSLQTWWAEKHLVAYSASDLKLMSYNIRRPHQVPLVSTKNNRLWGKTSPGSVQCGLRFPRSDVWRD